jgi:hypothetical protein
VHKGWGQACALLFTRRHDEVISHAAQCRCSPPHHAMPCIYSSTPLFPLTLTLTLTLTGLKATCARREELAKAHGVLVACQGTIQVRMPVSLWWIFGEGGAAGVPIIFTGGGMVAVVCVGVWLPPPPLPQLLARCCHLVSDVYQRHGVCDHQGVVSINNK